MKRLLILSLLMLFCPRASLAANWVLVGENSDETYFLDSETISCTKNSESCTAYQKIVTKPNAMQKVRKQHGTKKDIAYRIYRVKFICQQRKMIMESIILYGLNSDVILASPPISVVIDVVPDSMADINYRMICGK